MLLAGDLAVVTASPPAGASRWPSAGPARASTSSTVSYGLDSPDILAVDDGYLFVANAANNSVTELNATTGAFIRRLSSRAYGFDDPSAVRADGSYVAVANKMGDSVTVLLAKSGALVRVIREVGLAEPVAISVYRSYLFVVNQAGSVSEVTTSTGKVYRTLTASRYHFSDPVASTLAGTNLYVVDETADDASSYPGAVTVIAASTGRYLRTLSGSSFKFDHPTSIAFDGTHLWVTDSSDDQVAEVNAATGSEMNVVTNLWSPYPGFNGPTTVVASGGDAYVASSVGTPMMTQIFTSGSLPRVGFWMCNGNDPRYQFGVLSAVTVSGSNVWVASEAGNGYPGNSLTDINASTGTFVRYVG